jgi:hypothetical protein
MGRDTREAANELRAVAPLVVLGAKPKLVGPCTLVTNGAQTVAFSSAELLRHAGEPLAIVLAMDGSKTLRVGAWMMGRIAGMGVAELAEPFPRGATDVMPLQLGGVSATVDTRGAPAAIVTVAATAKGYERRIVPVHVDHVDGGGMSDEVTRLASPQDAGDAGVATEGAALFAWLPADPVLGRKSEVVAVALAVPYRAKLFKPRAHAPIAELVGLEDLGRALPWTGENAEGGTELGQVAGEIRGESSGPLAGLGFDDAE